MKTQQPVELRSDLERIGVALAQIPSGCSILTCTHGGKSTGILVSWVQQAGFSPPMVTVCLRTGRFALELVDASRRFLLNVIGEDPTAMFKHFGRGFGPSDDAFAGLDHLPTPYGSQLSACIAYLACDVTHNVLAGDHKIYVARVTSAGAVSGARPYVHSRKNGLSY